MLVRVTGVDRPAMVRTTAGEGFLRSLTALSLPRPTWAVTTWQLGVTLLVAVQEAPLPEGVQRVVGPVHIQHDLLRCLGGPVREQLLRQSFEPPDVGHDVLLAVLPRLFEGAQLKPVDGAAADRHQTLDLVLN